MREDLKQVSKCGWGQVSNRKRGKTSLQRYTETSFGKTLWITAGVVVESGTYFK